MDIEKVEKEALDVAGDVLKFYYTYSITYNPDHAEISFQGSVLVKPDKEDQITQILKDWKKKKIPEDFRMIVFNFIMTKCNLKALQLEDEFALPPHIIMPRISKQQKTDANYTG
jgi:hypothetical protein